MGNIKFAGQFITSGPEMVPLFFVLSGFVLMIAYFNKSNVALIDYYVKRVARIVPVYMVALIMTIFLFRGNGENSFTAILLNFTFLQSWFPPYSFSLNSPAWSLSIEMFFYLTFPFILYSIKKSNISWKRTALISLIIFFFTQAVLINLMNSDFYTGYPSISHDLIAYFPLSHFGSILIGISGGYLYLKRSEWFNKTGLLPLIVLVISIFINYFALQNRPMIRQIIGLRFSSSLFSILFLFLILSLVFSKSVITKLLSIPVLVLLGEASYSLYILQKPMYKIYTNVLQELPATFSLNQDSKFYIFAIFHILISIASLYIIEKPGKKLILNLYTRIKKPKIEI